MKRELGLTLTLAAAAVMPPECLVAVERHHRDREEGKRSD